MKKYIKLILFGLMLTGAVGTMTVSARDPLYSPMPDPPPPPQPETEPPSGPSPKTGDTRTNPVYPIAGSAAFAGIAVCAGVDYKKKRR